VNTAASPALAVVAAVIWRGDRFLAVQRPEGKSMAGFWEFPGGKVEPGESREAALIRELAEELDLVPVRLAYWKDLTHSYPQLTVRLSFFHIHGFKGVPRPLEGQGMRWLTPAEAQGLAFLEADREIVAELSQLTGD
jgi:8-oxo-dGTP diphosphatase